MAGNNIVQLFLNAADKNPDAIALIQDGVSISYGQLLEEVKGTASYYSREGIKKGDKVLVFVPMSLDLYRIVLALFYLGACPVFLDEWVNKDRLKACCRVVPCQGLIASRKFLFLSFFISELRKIRTKVNTGRKTGHDGVMPVEVTTEDTALITFTSGSTGIPKAANRTHGFLYAQYAALAPLLQSDTRISFVSLPIVVLINLGMGKTTVLPPKGFSMKGEPDITTLAKQIADNQVEEIICSPALLEKLIDQSGLTADNVKSVFTGGGPVFPDMADKLTTVLKEAKSLIVYGSTEAEPISHIEANVLAGTPVSVIKEKGLPVGRPDKHTMVGILPYSNEAMPGITADEFAKRQLAPGIAGEIVVTGAHVLKEYINNPSATAATKIKVDDEVWHRTGDMGRIDEDGNLFLLGNCKEVFTYKGRTYYPFVSSYLLSTSMGVQKTAVLLYKDNLVVVIEGTEPVPQNVLENALQASSLEEAKVIYLKGIPTDPRHRTKIDYEQLKELLG